MSNALSSGSPGDLMKPTMNTSLFLIFAVLLCGLAQASGYSDQVQQNEAYLQRQQQQQEQQRLQQLLQLQKFDQNLETQRQQQTEQIQSYQQGLQQQQLQMQQSLPAQKR